MSVDEFGLRYVGPRGPHYRSHCKKCERNAQTKRREETRDQLNQRRREHYKRGNYKKHSQRWYQRNKTYFVKYRENPENRKRERETERKRRESETPEARILRLERQRQANIRRRAASAAYRQRTKEHTAKTKQQWIMKHPHKRAEYEIERRARKAGAPREKVNRAAIVQRDECTCYLCGKKLELAEIHIDHVVPLSRDGTHTAANLRVTCASCNLKKARYTLDEFCAIYPSSFIARTHSVMRASLRSLPQIPELR